MSGTSQEMKDLARCEFEAWAETYDRSLLGRFLFEPSYRAFLGELRAWRAGRGEAFDLLDIGCGTGTLAARAAAPPLSGRTVGLDYSPAMCQVAAGKARRAGLGARARFVAGDSEHLAFADASFDIVTCGNSFHHYPHQEAVVREARRVLRPGGRFMLIDGFRDNVIGWVAYDVIIGAVEKQVHHASWSAIHRYFETAGFRDIRRCKFKFWLPLLLTVGSV